MVGGKCTGWLVDMLQPGISVDVRKSVKSTILQLIGFFVHITLLHILHYDWLLRPLLLYYNIFLPFL